MPSSELLRICLRHWARIASQLKSLLLGRPSWGLGVYKLSRVVEQPACLYPQSTIQGTCRPKLITNSPPSVPNLNPGSTRRFWPNLSIKISFTQFTQTLWIQINKEGY